MNRYETLTINMEDRVALVDLNRPEKGNSFDRKMWRELGEAFGALDGMPEIRVVVLAAAGKHFSTGIDLGYLAEIQQDLHKIAEGLRQERLFEVITDLQASISSIEICRKPVLAAIQGYCLGAGLDLAAACDMRYATNATRFSVKEVDLAIVADLGVLQRLPGIVGEGIARELAMTGRTFKGEEAHSIGFVNQLYRNADELRSGVLALAGDLAEKSPLALRGIKETMNFSRDHTVSDGLQYVALRNAAMLLSKDLEEAATAFFEKRKPRFKDC